MDEALKLAGAGLTAATIFCTNQAKEVLSVPAPRVRLTNRHGAKYYIAGIDQTVRQTTIYRSLGPILGKVGVIRDNKKDLARVAAGKNAATNPYLGGAKIATRDGVTYQTAPAIKGDPPRKLSGRLRSSVTYEMLGQMKLFQGGTLPTIGRVGTNVKYARSLEFHKNQHAFLSRVVTKYKPQIEAIIAETI